MQTCAVCEEAFQLFWVEEEEEWHFRDAMRVENKARASVSFFSLFRARRFVSAHSKTKCFCEGFSHVNAASSRFAGRFTIRRATKTSKG